MTDPSKIFIFNSSPFEYLEMSKFLKIMRHSQGDIRDQNIEKRCVPNGFLKAPSGCKVKLDQIFSKLHAKLLDQRAEEINRTYSYRVRTMKDPIREDFPGIPALATAFGHDGASVTAVLFRQRSILDIGRCNTRPHRIMPRQPDTAPGNLIAALLN
ncbi:hypothetical protein RZV17_09845 [Xanthomonas cannabis]|uniref:hypothetical protein n=1 Tax=Xanthomonas cannabis TaxID=1885674 RepID=UPI0033A468C2